MLRKLLGVGAKVAAGFFTFRWVKTYTAENEVFGIDLSGWSWLVGLLAAFLAFSLIGIVLDPIMDMLFGDDEEEVLLEEASTTPKGARRKGRMLRQMGVRGKRNSRFVGTAVVDAEDPEAEVKAAASLPKRILRRIRKGKAMKNRHKRKYGEQFEVFNSVEGGISV